MELPADDPRWIGCWWLGYLLVAVGILSTSVPLWFFPSTMTAPAQHPPSTCNGEGQKASRSGAQLSIRKKLWKQIKKFVRALVCLLRNRPYVYCGGLKICVNIVITGVLLNAVRYIEIAFYQPAAVASIISALSWSLAGALGSFGGGVIMSCLKLTPVGAVKLIIFSTCGFMTGVFIFLFLGCPQINIAVDVSPHNGRFTVYQPCNSHCACSTNQKSYDPVCGSDNVTYFSACIAGCTDSVNDTYTGCRCVGTSSALNSSLPEMLTSPHDVTARPGRCLPDCSLVIVYAIVIFLSTITLALCMAPDTVLNFRVVSDDERSFALAINSFAGNLFGYIPAPLLFGAITDSACRLWERADDRSSCPGGGRGSCLLYQTDDLRWRLFGVSLGVQFIQLTFAVLLYFAIRHRRFDTDADTSKSQSPVVHSAASKSPPPAEPEELALMNREQQLTA